MCARAFAAKKKKRRQIDIENPEVRERVVSTAIRRASKWMTLSREDATPLYGQVGGASVHKRPLLTLEPDYVLKPLLSDHRGLREVAFYECMAIVGSTSTDAYKAYRNFVKGNNNFGTAATTTITTTSRTITTASTATSSSSPSPSSSSWSSSSSQQSSWVQRLQDFIDTLAVLGAFAMHDRIVMALESDLEAARTTARNQWRREAELLRKLSNLTPAYYGVWGQEEYEPAEPYGVSAEDAHLLLHNITLNYQRPCVMDLKMGTQTYEPDAPLAKRDRESTKYRAQSTVGFRIVGMRVYDPYHPDADGTGFRFFDKRYGRSLETIEAVGEAFREFFTIPTRTATASTREESQQQQQQQEQQQQQQQEQQERKGKDKDEDARLQRQHTQSDDGVGATHGTTVDTGNGTVSANDEAATNATTTAVSSTNNNNNKEPLLRTRAISSLLFQIRTIRRWFEENDCFQFYASSLLIVYEGDRSASDVTACKMIDFGRVRRQAGGDKGYQHGLRTLKHLLSDLLDEEEERTGGGQAPLSN